MNNKGNLALDMTLGVVIFLILAIVALISLQLMDGLNADLQSSELSSKAKETSDDINTKLPKYLDYGFLTVFVMIWVFLMLSSFFLDNSPVFFVSMLILMIVSFFVGGAMQDFYTDFAGESEYVDMVDDLPIINFFMTNIFTTGMIVGFSVLIILYSKSKVGGGGGGSGFN